MPAIGYGTLNAVAAVGPSDAWAVGDINGGPSLALHWNGRVWRRTPAEGGELRAVAAFAPDDVWAAGFSVYGVGGLLLHWNGRRWMKTRIPASAAGFSPWGVSGSGPNHVWAVGYLVSHTLRSRLWRSTGTAATGHRSDPDGARARPGNPSLDHVAVRTPRDAWAVGHYPVRGRKQRQQCVAVRRTLGRKRWRLIHLNGNGDLRKVAIVSAVTSGPSRAERTCGSGTARRGALHSPPIGGHAVALAAAPGGPVWVASPLQHWTEYGWAQAKREHRLGEYISALAAASPTDIWAVGQASPSPTSQRWLPLALHSTCKS